MSEYRILITGSRHWSNGDVVRKEIAEWVATAESKGLVPVVVHGHCPTGADACANQIAFEMNLQMEVYPADWSQGRKAGPLRNQHMVDLGADVCLAFPLPNSRGTVDCMRRAHDAGIPVYNYGVL